MRSPLIAGAFRAPAIGLVGAAVAVALLALAPAPASAQNYRLDASPATKLRAVLRSHVYFGLPITRGMRAATGDPNITVIDRRQYGRNSRCTFINRSGRRILKCDS